MRTAVVAIVKEAERYVFEFDVSDQGYQGLCRALGRFAANMDLSFTWYDAAVLSQKARRIVQGVNQQQPG